MRIHRQRVGTGKHGQQADVGRAEQEGADQAVEVGAGLVFGVERDGSRAGCEIGITGLCH